MKFSASDQAQLDQLWSQYRQDKTLELRKKIAEFYLDLVRIVTHRVAITIPKHVDRNDLYASGVIGLMDAVQKYDFESGVKFETYASLRVRGAILDELRSLDWIPRSTRKKANDLEKMFHQLESELGREPSDEELAERMQIHVHQLHAMLSETSSAVLMSLDSFTEYEGGKQVQLLEILEDKRQQSSPSYHLEVRDVKMLLADAIETLSEQQRNVLALYYYERLMLKDIGAVMGISESRVSQIHTKAVLRLKSRLQKKVEELLG